MARSTTFDGIEHPQASHATAAALPVGCPLNGPFGGVAEVGARALRTL